MPSETKSSTPQVTNHTFYLFDDTDEVTRDLCGYMCGSGPENHISAADFLARERVRDAAPLLLDALKALLNEDERRIYQNETTGRWLISVRGDVLKQAQRALTAAQPAPLTAEMGEVQP